MRRLRSPLAAAAVGCLALSACGKDDSPGDPLAGIKPPRLPAVTGEAETLRLDPVSGPGR